jgi:hypothetical protein
VGTVLSRDPHWNGFLVLAKDSHPIIATEPNEFWLHVADQSEIPIAGTTDKSFDLAMLLEVQNGLPESQEEARAYLEEVLVKDIDFIDILRMLVGVSDKRMHLELSYRFGKTSEPNAPRVGVSGDSFYNLNRHPLSFFKKLASNYDKKKAARANISP